MSCAEGCRGFGNACCHICGKPVAATIADLRARLENAVKREETWEAQRDEARARLEAAERERDEARLNLLQVSKQAEIAIDDRQRKLETAERERDEAKEYGNKWVAALHEIVQTVGDFLGGEDVAETAVRNMRDIQRKLEAAREALKEIRDCSEDQRCGCCQDIADDALAALGKEADHGK